MDYLELDLGGTFYFMPRARRGTRDYARAEYSVEVLQLNEHPHLPVARAEAFGAYKARLTEYVHKKQRGAPKKKLALLVQSLQRATQPTVWREIQRQHRSLREFQELFREAPEAMRW